MKLMCCCKILFHFLLFYCICDLLDNRFLQKVAAKPKSNFDMSLKNESPMLELLIDTCVSKKWDNNVLIVIENAVDHCITFKCSFSSNTPIHLFQSNGTFDSRREFRDTYLMSNETEIAKCYKPISCAIIITSNITEFTKLMLEIKNSIWWQHEAYFVIVNIDYIDSCQLARAFLKQSWSFNVLSAIYVCKNLDDQEEVYTFNPYAAIAPKFWIRVDENALDTSWSLFQFSLKQILALTKRGRLVCDNLFFDKSKNLHGTNVKVGLEKSHIQRYDSTKSGYERFTSPYFSIMASALRRMNATVTVKFSDTLLYINSFGEPQGILKDLMSGTVSMNFNERFIRHYWKFQVHSFRSQSLVVVALKKQMTLIEKLGKLSSTFFICLFIMSLAMTGSLKYILKQSVSLAALNFIRICLSNSSSTVPQNTARRILLILFIIVAFVLNSWVLGYFTAMASTSDRLAVIDSYDDLIKSDLAIGGVNDLNELIWSEDIRNRSFETSVKDPVECFYHLLNGDNSIACVTSKFLMNYFLREGELFHVSKHSLFDRGISYFIAEDFPCFSRIQSVLLKMSEGGFVTLFYAREAFYRHVRSSESYTVKGVKLEYIYYLLTILIGSWILAILVLCVEIVAFKFKYKPHKWCRFTYVKLTEWLSNNNEKNHVKRSDKRLKTLKLKNPGK